MDWGKIGVPKYMYKPFTEQEESDKNCILQYLNDFDNVFSRENNYGHFTSSAWGVNKEQKF